MGRNCGSVCLGSSQRLSWVINQWKEPECELNQALVGLWRKRSLNKPDNLDAAHVWVNASVAQRIEQEPSNLLVVGSIPARGTKLWL